MNYETNRIKDLIRRHYDGETWHGPSLIETLSDVSHEQAVKRLLPNTHNIAEIVAHLTNWRVFVLEKLTGGDTYDIVLDSEADWLRFDSLTLEQWHDLLVSLADTHAELLDVMEAVNDRRLNDIVPGRKYSYYILLHGGIQHEIYHSGQISLLKKV
ncbi:MAG: DinB family protein [Cytophagaceae bacterium]|nr:DinB family protein [Cytophagaceae bacterium]